MPAEYGGGGGDFLHHVILHEEMGYSVAGASMGGGFGIDGSSYLISAGGTEAQKREWIPRYASGETIAEACFTEPQSGSDVAGFRTNARLDGEHYVLNGQKIWITNGNLVHDGSRWSADRVRQRRRGHEHSAGGLRLARPVPRSKPIPTLHRGCANGVRILL